MSLAINSFENRALASAQAAELLADALKAELEDSATATLAVSGGSTPQACFQHLAQIPLPWDRVFVTLTDERCVPAQHPDSNERMLRQTLLTDHAAAAQFLPLQKIPSQQQAAGPTPAPFAAVLLGMGTDGHFASLFPDAVNLSEGLDLANLHATINIDTAASPHPRISMTLPRLLNTRQLLLLAFGNDKQVILKEPAAYPVGQLLQEIPHHPSAQILWAD